MFTERYKANLGQILGVRYQLVSSLASNTWSSGLPSAMAFSSELQWGVVGGYNYSMANSGQNPSPLSRCNQKPRCESWDWLHVITLQGANISRLGKRNMLVSKRVHDITLQLHLPHRIHGTGISTYMNGQSCHTLRISPKIDCVERSANLICRWPTCWT